MVATIPSNRENGAALFFYAKEAVLDDGEELLILRSGKKAQASVSIGTGEDASHKVFLTTNKIQIDGPLATVNSPYSEVNSVRQDTHLKMDMAITIKFSDQQEYKLAFGLGRGKRRDEFLEAINSMLPKEPDS